MADVEVAGSRVCVFPGCERPAAPPPAGGGPAPRYCDLPDHNPQADAARTAAQAAVQTAEAAAEAEVAAARADAAEQIQRVHAERDEAVAEVRAAADALVATIREDAVAQVAAAHGERDTAIDDTARREQYERSPQVDRARRYARDHVAWTYDQLPPAERELLETSTAQGWLDGWWAAQQDRTSDGAGVQREDDR